MGFNLISYFRHFWLVLLLSLQVASAHGDCRLALSSLVWPDIFGYQLKVEGTSVYENGRLIGHVSKEDLNNLLNILPAESETSVRTMKSADRILEQGFIEKKYGSLKLSKADHFESRKDGWWGRGWLPFYNYLISIESAKFSRGQLIALVRDLNLPSRRLYHRGGPRVYSLNKNFDSPGLQIILARGSELKGTHTPSWFPDDMEFVSVLPSADPAHILEHLQEKIRSGYRVIHKPAK